MANKLEDQQILDKNINRVFMETGEINQQSIGVIMDEIISKVVEDAEDKQRGGGQVLRTDADHRIQDKKTEALTMSHREQVHTI